MTDMDRIRLKRVNGELFYEGVKLPEDLQDLNVAGGNVQKLYNEMQTAVDNRNSFFTRVGAFLRAENKAGRKAGAVLDFITLFVPFGQKVDNARDAVKVLLERQNQKGKGMKKILSRAFGTDGGGFIKVRDENGKIDGTAIAASIIRAGVIIGLLYVAELAGVMDQFLALTGLGAG